jgi:hypothetical protein
MTSSDRTVTAAAPSKKPPLLRRVFREHDDNGGNFAQVGTQLETEVGVIGVRLALFHIISDRSRE